MSALVSPGPLVWFRDRGLVAIAAAAAVVAVLYGAEVVPLGGLGVASWIGMLLLQGWTAWQARDIAVRPTTPPAVARFWRFVSAAVALFGVGSATALVTAFLDTGAIRSPI